MNRNLTVKQLLEFIEKNNIPMDAEVRYQRIEDWYFEKGGWKSIKKEGNHYWLQKQMNERIETGYFDNKDQFPLIDDPEKFKYSDEELEGLQEKYIPADSCVKYPNDSNLYIDAHY